MKIVVVYTHVATTKPFATCNHDAYQTAAKRFCDSYYQNRPTVPHKIHVVNCGGGVGRGYFERVEGHDYYGDGKDTGAYVHTANMIDADFMVCCNAHAYFHRDGWLERFVQAFKLFGPALYGASASFENGAHLRNPCIAAPPSLFRRYPIPLNDAMLANASEAGATSFTNWFEKETGTPSMLLTWDGCCGRNDFRTPRNGFRRGDQSDMLVWDRHSDIFAAAGAEEKKRLTALADGKAI